LTLFLELLAVAVLILLNGFFVAAEYALVTVRRTRLHELEEQGNRRAKLVLRITAVPPKFIAAMQLGVTVTSLGIGALGEPALRKAFEPAIASSRCSIARRTACAPNLPCATSSSTRVHRTVTSAYSAATK